MRTTVAIDDHLLARAKRRARERGVSLGTVIEDALRRDLNRSVRTDDRPPIPVFAGTGVRPGVDLTSNRAVRELLDDDRSLTELR
jgi:Ribbon-helix-helix protein, copG family